VEAVKEKLFKTRRVTMLIRPFLLRAAMVLALVAVSIPANAEKPCIAYL
jgi:hypothetical protein